MAIFHTHIKAFSRGKGESSIAAAAYRAGIDLVNTRTREVYRFSKRKGVLSYRMLAPHDAPDWALDPHAFWDVNESRETRQNARVGREVETSLPCELNAQQREALALELAQMLVDRYRCAVLMAIHAPTGQGDNRNHHVHLLMSARQVGPDGLGDRAGADFDTSGRGAGEVRWVRAEVSRIVNEHLRLAGSSERVDHRTLAAQAMEAAARGDVERARELRRTPTSHAGRYQTALERKKTAKPEDIAAWDEAVERARSAGTLLDTPDGHAHGAALADRLIASRPDPRDLDAFKSAWLDENVWTPRSYGDLQQSSVARHLGSIGNRARIRKEGAEVFATVSELVEAWLTSIRDMAHEAIERVRSVVGAPCGEVVRVVKTLGVRRVHIYGTKPNFFHDTEFLVHLLRDYLRALASPRIKEQRLSLARNEVYLTKERHGTNSREFLIAKREFWMAKQKVSDQTKERDRKRSAAALAALQETCSTYEQTYFVNCEQPVTGTDAAAEGEVQGQQDADQSRNSDSNARELKPRPFLSGSLGMRRH